MKKEIITNYLNKFNYDFTEMEEKVVVKLDFSLEILIDLSIPDKINISDRLKSKNFLSWPFSMSIKGTMLYNFIFSFIVMLLFLGLRNSYNNFVLTLVVIFAAFWNLYWLIYYLIKAENFRKEIIYLTK